MTASIEDKSRHIFPRWRSFRATARLGELTEPVVGKPRDTSDLDISLARGIADWEESPTLWRGLDLLGSAMVAGKIDSFSTLVDQIRANPLAPELIRNVLHRLRDSENRDVDPIEPTEQSESSLHHQIRTHRRRIIEAPRDAIEWIELARGYTTAGVNHKAERSIRAALQLAPNNRFVLRSAARFLIHIGDKEAAHHLLTKSAVTSHDPWLLASEIAISSSIGRTSKLIRVARAKAEADIRPSEVTELASALGTLEAENGKSRVAKRFLRQALNGANENSVAQIQWLNRSCLGEGVDVSNANPPLLHEAKAWTNFYAGSFEEAKDESLRWLQDQPFASAPAVLSTFILADIMGNYQEGKRISKAALFANPEDPMLLNNLAVCLLELGELEEAETTLERLKLNELESRGRAIFSATYGMLAFRKGDIDEGRRLYLEAINVAKEAGAKITAARAALHLALEELAARSPAREEAITRLREFKEVETERELSHLLRRLKTIIESD
jgi:tetratricopeptide (TPR) repeat protein